MKNGGCHTINVGLETANEEGLSFIGKGITAETATLTVKKIQEAGMRARIYLMFGLPFDSEETVDQNLKLINEMCPDGVQLALAIPLPGSELYSRADELGIELHPDTNQYYYLGPSGPHTFIKSTKHLNEQQFIASLKRLEDGILEWSSANPSRFTNVSLINH